MSKIVWCLRCLEKIPVEIKKAEHLVLIREGHYELAPNTVDIDTRLVGICSKCLDSKNKFQRDNIEEVDIDNPNLVYRGFQR